MTSGPSRRRAISFVTRSSGIRYEEEPLLADEGQVDGEGCYPPHWTQQERSAPNPHADLPVYATIHR